MKKLSEKEIIELMNKKKIRSEDVEIFKLGNEQCAVCVDTLVESTDIPKCSKLSDISRKSVVSSLSDFASKGIIPKFCIISLTLPKTISKKQVQELSKGFSKVCKEFKIQLLGGDTNQGNEISIHVVLFGNVKNFIRRNDAKVKDVICTTGPFGYTASALEIIMKKRKSVQSFSTKSKNLFFKPKPRLKFGQESVNYITSSMDSSDGLSSCLNELSNQSKKKFLITKIPTNDDVIEFAEKNKISLNRLVFDGGEEFELVFTVTPKNLKKIHTLAKKNKISIFEIGHVSKGNGVFFDDGNDSFIIKDKGWQHFR
ncbi:MAG: thiamine-phosphate kinase [Thaumarchaeota archaeon]|jgi:thiamine-monophosphate kinase|nr:thiamine-phosphate kinase [Nitrososphaerota archaeon]MBT5993909.1 thiamine-phosphate kinase [Nitrososphaerota archaeon]|tara:strand:- start:50 stop:988 length:939 start_codon:yes stop_codon:yes gene_type:complete